MAHDTESVRMLEGGRIVIPARFRKALGITPGDTLVVELDGEDVRITTKMARIRRAQELVRPYIGANSLADELIAERRAEAAAEERD